MFTMRHSPGPNLHRGQYRLTHNGHNGLGQELVRDITIVLDKPTDSSLKFTVSDEIDPIFLCVLIITRGDYDEMKKIQGLLVDFDAFPAQFVKLLQQCQCGNMFLSLYQDGPSHIYLEIIERNDFKKLVHLSLKLIPASDSDIKQNMANNIEDLKRKLATAQTNFTNGEVKFCEKERFLEMRINDLTNLIKKEKDDKLERENEYHLLLKRERDRFDQEKEEFKKNAEAYSKSQIVAIQESLNRKEKQLDDSQSRCRQLQDTIKSLESQISDKTQKMVNVEKQLHTIKIDADTWRNQNGALDREFHDVDMQLTQTKTRLNDAEKKLREKSDLLRDALDSLQSVKRDKIMWEEKANINETLATRKNQECQSLNEQLLKANQIIAKQNTDILELREKLMCRTAIALEQEKVINANVAEISELKATKKGLHEDINNAKKDHNKILEDMESLKNQIDDKTETIKNNNDVIQWLHKKIDALQSVNEITVAASNRLPATFDPSRQEVDKNSNFAYSSDRLSNLYIACPRDEDKMTRSSSIPTESSSNHPKDMEEYSIDPVYLKPNIGSSKASSRNSSRKKFTPLPNINKFTQNKTSDTKSKSARSISKEPLENENCYIATGMSAYFPRK